MLHRWRSSQLKDRKGRLLTEKLRRESGLRSMRSFLRAVGAAGVADALRTWQLKHRSFRQFHYEQATILHVTSKEAGLRLMRLLSYEACIKEMRNMLTRWLRRIQSETFLTTLNFVHQNHASRFKRIRNSGCILLLYSHRIWLPEFRRYSRAVHNWSMKQKEVYRPLNKRRAIIKLFEYPERKSRLDPNPSPNLNPDSVT